MQELTTEPMKNILSRFLVQFDLNWFKNFIDKQGLPNIPLLMKALPNDIKKIIESRLKDDYAKYRDQFTYHKFIFVLREYRPDLYEIAIIPYGERWFKAFWLMLDKYFRSL